MVIDMQAIFVRKLTTTTDGNDTVSQGLLVKLNNVTQISHVAVTGGSVYRVAYTDGEGVNATRDFDTENYICSIGKELF